MSNTVHCIVIQYVEEVTIHSITREVYGNIHTLYFKISDTWMMWPSPLNHEQCMRVATPSTFKMGGTCGGGGHPVATNVSCTLCYKMVQYSIVYYNLI